MMNVVFIDYMSEWNEYTLYNIYCGDGIRDNIGDCDCDVSGIHVWDTGEIERIPQ